MKYVNFTGAVVGLAVALGVAFLAATPQSLGSLGARLYGGSDSSCKTKIATYDCGTGCSTLFPNSCDYPTPPNGLCCFTPAPPSAAAICAAAACPTLDSNCGTVHVFPTAGCW